MSQSVPLGLLTALLFYLHFTAIIFLFGEVMVFSVAALASRNTVSRRGLVISGFVAMGTSLICLPGLLQLVKIAEVRQQWDRMVDRQAFADQFWNAFGVIFSALILVLIFRRLKRAELASGTVVGCVILIALFAVPILTSGLLGNYHVAGLSMYRYNAASFAIWAVAVGVISSRAPKGLLRATCVSIVVLTVWFSNEHVRAWVNGGQPVQMRFENWQTVSEKISQDNLPIFLFPNLVEDFSFPPNPSGPWRAYYRFPLETKLYETNTAERFLEGFPIPGFEGLSDDALTELVTTGSAWLILRGWQEDAFLILEKIEHQFADAGLVLLWEPSVDEGSVHLVRLTWLPIRWFH